MLGSEVPRPPQTSAMSHASNKSQVTKSDLSLSGMSDQICGTRMKWRINLR